MAHIDALIDKIADPTLRHALREQLDIILEKQSFGLVFQEHKPETVELPSYQIRRGCKVRYHAKPGAFKGRKAVQVESEIAPAPLKPAKKRARKAAK